MGRRRARVTAVAMVLAVTATVGCGGKSPSRQSPSNTTFSVDVRTETLVDTSRGTEERNNQLASSSRTLETTIYLPGGTERPRGAYPLIVFVHGSGGNPDFYRPLLEGWSAKGYVVATPRFPSDLANQPGDVSFVITELLRLGTAGSGPYAGLVDAKRIGVAGHSAGGVAVLGVAFNTCCIDPRVRAGAVLAAELPPVPGGTYFTGISTPLLVVHSVADPTVPFAGGRRIFTDARPPKMMLSVPASDTPSADHARPYVGTENRTLPDTRVVIATTVAFFDRYLRDDRDALDRMRTAVDAEVSFRLEVVEA
jgi:poly(3-hydroxybutyrate) depolymerase